MNPRDMSPEREAYSTRVLTLTCMSDFMGIRRLWMRAFVEGIADGHDLRGPPKNELKAIIEKNPPRFFPGRDIVIG